MSSTLNLKSDGKAALRVVDFHPRMLFSIKKFLFFWFDNTGVKLPFFKFSLLKLQKLLKPCRPFETEISWGQLSVEIVLIGLPHIVKAASETWLNPCVSSYQRELIYFLLRDWRHANHEFRALTARINL